MLLHSGDLSVRRYERNRFLKANLANKYTTPTFKLILNVIRDNLRA